MKVVGNPKTFKLRLVVGIALSIVAVGLASFLIVLLLLPNLRSVFDSTVNKLSGSATDCVILNGNVVEGPESCNNFKDSYKKDGSETNISYTNLSEGYYSGLTTKEDKEITTRADLEKYWAQIHEGTTPVPSVPTVDFSNYEVILVALGTKNTSGYGIEITGVSGSTVTVAETSPKPGDGTLQVLTQPYHMVQIKKPATKLIFVHQITTY